MAQVPHLVAITSSAALQEPRSSLHSSPEGSVTSVDRQSHKPALFSAHWITGSVSAGTQLVTCRPRRFIKEILCSLTNPFLTLGGEDQGHSLGLISPEERV